ncbi:MAG: N-acetyltransferase family protein [Spirochaetota bacterium]
MISVQIRLAQLNDLDQIVRIYNQAVKTGEKTGDLKPVTVKERLQWLAAHSSERYPVYAAAIAEQVIGFLSVSPYRPGRAALRHTAEVSYYVDSAYHGSGIATKLLSGAIADAPRLGLRTYFAVVLETNEASIRLLKKFGFTEWGHLPNVADFNGREIGQRYYGLRVAP